MFTSISFASETKLAVTKYHLTPNEDFSMSKAHINSNTLRNPDNNTGTSASPLAQVVEHNIQYFHYLSTWKY